MQIWVLQNDFQGDNKAVQFLSDLTGEFSGRWLLQSLFFLDESEFVKFRFWQIFRSFY